MDSKTLKKYVEKQFILNTLPNLMNFIRIPNLSPGFDPDWNTNGLLLKAANLIISFAKSLNIKNAEINLLQDSPYTPLVFIDIPATRQNDKRTVLFYGHYDKQPYGTGWDKDKSPTNPVIVNGRLYGRGSADDGYASFSILTAIKTCQEFNCPMPRICCIFEGAEETIDFHIRYYFDKLMPVLGQNIVAFIPLDSGCSDYNRMWIANSLRGFCDFDINIKTLDEVSHYGPEGSGVIAENLFLLRKIYDGFIDSTNGEFKLEEFKVDKIPEIIEEQLKKEIEVVGDTRASIRVPPSIDQNKAMEAVKKALSDNTFFGAQISLGDYEFGDGVILANVSNRTKNILNKASLEFFGNEICFSGVGGSIPFITYFKSLYPNTDILCTGVVGSDSNEHGPNENLNIEACKKMICVLCYFLSEI